MSHRTIIESLLSLSVIQAASFIAPLFAVPLLTRTLGTAAWGEVTFVIFAMQFLLMLTDYGFSLSAVRNIAQVQKKPDAVSAIFSACWFLQWLLLAGVIIITIIGFASLNLDLFYLVGLSLVLGNVLFPMWLFQGLEKLKVPALVQLLARLIMLSLIFAFVTGPEDAGLALFFLTGHNLIAGPILLFWAFSRRQVTFAIPKMNAIRRTAAEGWGIFVSKIFISSYTSLIPIILGSVAGSESVGLYYVADKIRVAANYVLSPLSQALFPRTSYLFKEDRAAARRLIVKYGAVLFLLSLLFSAILFYFADFFVWLVAGTEFHAAVLLLQIMAITPTMICLSNIFGVQLLLPMERTKEFNRSIQIGGVISLLGVWPMVNWLEAAGAASISAMAEAIVAAVMAFYLIASIRHAKNRKNERC
jgi:O-antigen/teichoic acid export membrane protein